MLSKKIICFVVVSTLAIMLAITANNRQFLHSIENKSWDFRLKLTAEGKAKADPNIKIIIVDQASLDHYAENEGITWPWPRTFYVPVLRYLKAAGAKGAAFDLLFSEGSIHGVEEDIEFATELLGTMPIVSTVAPVLAETSTSSKAAFSIFKKRQLQEESKTAFSQHFALSRSNLDFSAVTLPIPDILKRGAAFGSTWVAPDSDGVFRHYWSGGYIKNVPLLSLAFSLHNAVAKEPIYAAGELEKFFDTQGRLTVRFHGGQRTYETIPIADVISSYISEFEDSSPDKQKPIVPLETFKDAWVFIGVWAPGLLDLRPIPLDEVYKGVEYHATVLDNLLHKDFIRKVPPYLNNIYSALLILLTTAAVFFIQRQSIQVLCYLIIAGAFAYSGFALTAAGYWIQMVVPMLSITLALITSLALQYYLEDKERRFIKNAFSRYVSPKLIQKILADPDSLALGGEKRELTIFFSDLAGFTTISESLPADQLVSLLNRYLSAMTDIILDSGATLDKYEGDAIIAFWNAPVTIAQHPIAAVEAALKCQEKLAELRTQFQTEYGVALHMRIGLHTGIVNVGNFGSLERFDYTVIGDAANLASRLEGVNKVFGTPILISQNTKEQLENRIPCRKLGSIKVVGKKEAIDVYQPLAASYDMQTIEMFHRCLELYENKQLSEALEGFSKLQNDAPAQAYITKIMQELETVESGNWSPIWNLTSK